MSTASKSPRPKSARKVKLPPLKVLVIDEHGRRVVKMPDPRAMFCQSFREWNPGATVRPIDNDDRTKRPASCAIVNGTVQGYAQVIERMPDGSETVMWPAVELKAARRMALTFNRLRCGKGGQAIVYPLAIPSLARSGRRAGKVARA